MDGLHKWKIIVPVVITIIIALVTVTLYETPSQQASTSAQAIDATNRTIIPTPDFPPEREKLFGTDLIPLDRPFVALYGSPSFKQLGSLGEQSLEETIVRARNVSAPYSQITATEAIPTFEIIVTVASAGPTEDGDYSQELDPNTFTEWIERAARENIYVIIDLQPGRDSFLTQAKMYESLLLQPHVGLALDPEWRLQTMEARHLKTVGSVTSGEINETSIWLADLVAINKLPQKIFMVHQFKRAMVSNREAMITTRPELAYMVHADGHGNLGQKIDTWNNIRTDLTSTVLMGWKNFYDEDQPTPTPEQTMAQTPRPNFVSYQ